MTAASICTNCGTHYPPGQTVHDICIICNDDRQFVSEEGQHWISLPELKSNHRTVIKQLTDKLWSLQLDPLFGIGNRALLYCSAGGNILWDCLPMVDAQSIEFIRSKGGLKAIAISHPHFYNGMNEWANAFNCPVYVHANDNEWIQYRTGAIQAWDRDNRLLWDGIEIIHTGGHFPGSCVLHIPSLTDRGTVLSGDSLYISRNRKHMAVMHSFPNQVPLSRNEFVSFDLKIAGLFFDNMYGAFPHQNLAGNAFQIFNKSMQFYRENYGLPPAVTVKKVIDKPAPLSFVIRLARMEDYDYWLPLWNGYNTFYGRSGNTALNGDITKTTWNRFFDPEEPIQLLVAESGDQLLGFTHYIFHRSSISIAPVCYLQDLFTAESARNKGIAGALIKAVYKAAMQNGAPRVYWHTHESNTTARKLYEQVAQRSGFIVYSKNIGV